MHRSEVALVASLIIARNVAACCLGDPDVRVQDGLCNACGDESFAGDLDLDPETQHMYPEALR